MIGEIFLFSCFWELFHIIKFLFTCIATVKIVLTYQDTPVYTYCNYHNFQEITATGLMCPYPENVSLRIQHALLDLGKLCMRYRTMRDTVFRMGPKFVPPLRMFPTASEKHTTYMRFFELNFFAEQHLEPFFIP
jgi:hypothetical protein